MRILVIIYSVFFCFPSHGLETRCGWVDGVDDIFRVLVDRDGEWNIYDSGYSAVGAEKLVTPQSSLIVDVHPFQYYCACMRVEANRQEMKIKAIQSMQVLPIVQCLQDKSIALEKGDLQSQISEDQRCQRNYALYGGDCQADHPQDDEAFLNCLRPVRFYAERCCQAGTEKCTRGMDSLLFFQ